MTYTNFRLVASALLLSVPLQVTASVARAGEVEIANMTWIEVRDAIAAGREVVIVPTGGTEQNGPHMITGKHNVIVAEAARRIASQLGNALVAPVLAYTPEGDVARREGHTAYPGTISISEAAFEGVLDGATRSFAAAGFKLIVLIGDSGPNQAGQERVAEKLTREFAPTGVRVISASEYYAGQKSIELLIADGESPQTIGVHAGIRDTSELMAVLPGGVRMDKRGADALGGSGDARKATAERGAKLLDLRIAAAVAQIRAAKAMPGKPATGSWLDWFGSKN